jgi:UDP-N-acetylmuramoyl-L-alanyl-D-glutamate--2,6-diaminopimelate ligase
VLLTELLRILGLAEDARSGKTWIASVATASRRATPGALFCALRGEHHDGSEFIPDAERRGAAAAITERANPESPLPQIVVEDARAASRRAAWALWGEEARGIRLAGVTGTNGKTTVAWLLRDMLRAGGFATGVVGTLGRDVGSGLEATGFTTPEMAELLESIVLMRRSGMTWGVVEVSSHALALGRVFQEGRGPEFSVAVFTNLSRDHLDFHGTMRAYLDAKAALFERLDSGATAVLNREDPASKEIARRTRARVVWSGVAEGCDVRAAVAAAPGGGDRRARLVARAAGDSAEFPWPHPGRHGLENLASAAAAALAAGAGMEAVARAAVEFRGVPGRLEAVATGLGFRVYVDYAHTPAALEAVLASLRPETAGRLVCVFGAGGDRDREKRPFMGKAASGLADSVIVTSDNPRTEDPMKIIEDILGGVADRSSVEVEPDRARAIGLALERAGEGDVVLIAGKGHEREQIVGNRRMPFDDREVAREALSALARSG